MIIGSSNAKTVQKQLRVDAKQYPRILSSALTGVAYEARVEAQQSAKKELDRPTRFTLNAIIYRKSTPKTLKSSVLVNPKNDYLHRVVYGGIRRDPGRQIFIPAKRLRTNAYGNITRARRRRLLNSADTRGYRKGGIKVLANKRQYVGVVVKQTRYKTGGYWKFHDSGRRSFDRHFDNKFNRAYRRALR